jgi:hypothetical protein
MCFALAKKAKTHIDQETNKIDEEKKEGNFL